jgi:hypothetical protein
MTTRSSLARCGISAKTTTTELAKTRAMQDAFVALRPAGIAGARPGLLLRTDTLTSLSITSNGGACRQYGPLAAARSWSSYSASSSDSVGWFAAQVPAISASDSDEPFLPQCAGPWMDLIGMPCNSHRVVVTELKV